LRIYQVSIVMHTRDYYKLLKQLMERCLLKEEDMIFVENIADWCRKCDIPEPDKERPLKFISHKGYGSKMLVKEDISDNILNERLNALSIRGQLLSVAHDRSELLNSDEKQLAYLFLSEIANGLHKMHDELLADNWVFEEMEKRGFFEN
jgi:hypothetical protein